MTGTLAHQCDRCRVTVSDNRLADSHCGDPECPLNALRAERRQERKDAKTKLSDIMTAG